MMMFDRSHVENILPERLEKYMREFESDMKFDERDIHEKTLERSSIAAKWCRFSYEEEKYKKKILESVEKLKEQIAEKLFISTHTVDSHRKNLIEKFKTSNLSSAITTAIEYGLISKP